MDPCIEDRVIQLLRDSPSPAVSIRDLHGALAAEAGDAYASRARLEESLRRRRDLFLVLETPSPLGEANEWPAGARTAYERALTAAGFDPGPHVSLVDPDPDTQDPWPDLAGSEPHSLDAPLRQLRDSLLRLWQTADGNVALRRTIAAALAGCRDFPAALREGDNADR